MEFHELEMSYNAEFDLIGSPSRRDMFERDPAIIVVEKEKQYGLRIYNLSDIPLYPHLFYFDPSELTIIPWYLPPTGARSSNYLKTDIILPPKSSFTIGYGEGSVDPWEFMLNGITKDVGFFKLFVTTLLLDLGSISQESPYDDGNGAHNRSVGDVSAEFEPVLDSQD